MKHLPLCAKLDVYLGYTRSQYTILGWPKRRNRKWGNEVMRKWKHGCRTLQVVLPARLLSTWPSLQLTGTTDSLCLLSCLSSKDSARHLAVCATASLCLLSPLSSTDSNLRFFDWALALPCLRRLIFHSCSSSCACILLSPSVKVFCNVWQSQ